MNETTPLALIVDFGGVLTTDLWESFRVCDRSLGLPDNTLLDLLRTEPTIGAMYTRLERGEVDQSEFEPRLAAAAGVSPQGLLARMCADLRPCDEMLNGIESLRKAGIKVGILSNSCGPGYFDPYEGYDLDTRADSVIISDRVGMRKPEPAIFRLMLDSLGTPADRTVFVDDTASHLTPAQQMGLTAIHHTDPFATLAQLDQVFPGNDLASRAR